jgi:hypothetical protein
MRLPILGELRPGERIGAAAAFLTLLGILTAHTLLETARDALFLAELPASQLPWVYLAIAAIAAALSQAPWSPRRLLGGRYRLSLVFLLVAAVSLAFWALKGWGSHWMLRALFVWTGLAGTATVMELWLALGERYTVTQAKRIYRIVALGGLLGSVAGAALAQAITASAPQDRLVLASAGALVVTALGPALFLGRPEQRHRRQQAPAAGLFRVVRAHRYLRGLAVLVLLSAAALTLVDYVFKSAVAATVPPTQLGYFFATYYAILNALALLAQLLLLPAILRFLGLPRAQGFLPALLALGALGVVSGGGIMVALLLKGFDGTLREVHRTSSELLFVPIPDDLRARTKPLVDAVGKRAGQALGSVAILAALLLPRADTWIAAGAALLCVAWIASAAALRQPYLDLFRSALREGRLREREEPEPLDLGSLEALFAALNSRDDAEVMAAMDLLAEQGRARLVPALILYHPSDGVVLHALELFERSGRADLSALADRLLGHRSPEIRAAALRMRTGAVPDLQILRAATRDESPLVRATALAGIAAVAGDLSEVQPLVDELLAGADPAPRRALARAIAQRPSPAFEDLLLQLAWVGDPELLRDVARAMGALHGRRFLSALLPLLVPHEVRGAAREAFLQFGEDGLRFLAAALVDPRQPHEIRIHLPRTLSRFPPALAAPILLARLPEEPDGMVRFKILRGLGRIAADHPRVKLDRALLQRACADTLEAIFRLVHWRIVLLQGAVEDPRRATPTHALLAALLRDKQVHAIERLFRMLALRFRGEDVEGIYRGMRSADPKVRASSRELLEHLLASPARSAVLSLGDDVPDRERLAASGPYYQPRPLDYEELIAQLLDAPGQTLQVLAACHAAELGLSRLRGRVEEMCAQRAANILDRTVHHALRILTEREKEGGADAR